VTAENGIGEGSMNTATHGPRPNVNPCP
jgi:hypothetical protein